LRTTPPDLEKTGESMSYICGIRDYRKYPKYNFVRLTNKNSSVKGIFSRIFSEILPSYFPLLPFFNSLVFDCQDNYTLIQGRKAT
jgi:hypothetical protein